ncbi:sensor histidine kinase [Halapricum hydrolyticum]|uniref:HAMP domain-containing histidine kinase n=1 Tax=Halapricum hydrolyticum TaxID=2979991 RepID=A0AAE3IC83_9EURY|nr:HAMP domain-containing sensor histidine kinase [Halapricum hydrolyticum]MCU4716675.1 HAMP domain-containing histidine kinase [Halapricum hydrolyticum]MCU4725720.1 HAMP domain-containing histidine kinase [Halapricum hydrolyticum]
MSFEEQPEFARQVADLNNYGQALNSCETVEEVVSLTLEAVSLLFDFESTTFIEVREGEPEIIESTRLDRSAGDQPGPVARAAVESGETTTETDSEAGVPTDSGAEAALAVPATIVDDVVVVLVVRTATNEDIGESYATPLEMLASHAATAISNIRSHQELERARTDLAKRKEMVELYDRLLRHDLGNDLQVISGFADILVEELEGDHERYARKICRAAESSSDLIQRVGNLVSRLEAEAEPVPRDLRDALASVVETTHSQYESLTVEFDPAEFDYRVYGGDLLDSVFQNVLSNAAVHNEGGVTVSMYAEATPSSVVVGMADDGSGIPAEIRDELFEMGEKGPSSDGTGLGLGFVRTLTESYGGAVEVTDSEYGGAEFRVTLQRV